MDAIGTFVLLCKGFCMTWSTNIEVLERECAAAVGVDAALGHYRTAGFIEALGSLTVYEC